MFKSNAKARLLAACGLILILLTGCFEQRRQDNPVSLTNKTAQYAFEHWNQGLTLGDFTSFFAMLDTNLASVQHPALGNQTYRGSEARFQLERLADAYERNRPALELRNVNFYTSDPVVFFDYEVYTTSNELVHNLMALTIIHGKISSFRVYTLDSDTSLFEVLDQPDASGQDN